ncbi:energy transducer TonB [Xanthovirga aplysinae]|uniref:energy transducer TonB n=1 Tax=Xanthovirga aplysinae TaxID=2529853 RepID=UPI0012BD2468|nr:energy transducer TonB [Xanthovirga aplysinae]MTI29260.1 energy transducer TonB [Xanthovirga aplysinae]
MRINRDFPKILFFILILTFSCAGPKVTVHKKIVGKEGVEQPDSQPEFIGGWEAYEKYIKENIKYPLKARTNRTEGEVVISFVIRKGNGAITDVEIVKSVSPEIDEEALRLISNMPNWKPAIKDEKEVSVRLQIPIDFKL